MAEAISAAPCSLSDHETASGRPCSAGRFRAATEAKKQSMSTCRIVRSPPAGTGGSGGGGGSVLSRSSKRIFQEPMKCRREAAKKSPTKLGFSALVRCLSCVAA